MLYFSMFLCTCVRKVASSLSLMEEQIMRKTSSNPSVTLVGTLLVEDIVVRKTLFLFHGMFSSELALLLSTALPVHNNTDTIIKSF